MIGVLRENLYFFIMLLTGAYGLTYSLYLATRYNRTSTARLFTAFLAGVTLWSVKDALSEALMPRFLSNPDGFAQLLAIVSPMYLSMPVFSFLFLTSVYNAAVPTERRLRHVTVVAVLIGAVLAAVYAAALFDPRVLYRSIAFGQYDYTYVSGPGLYVFMAVIVLSTAFPIFMLFRAAWARWRSEAFYIGIGAVLTLIVAVTTNVIPSLVGFTNIPRLGCLSASVLCALTFIGIVRYGSMFRLSRILEEREKYRLIADGLEGLVGISDEAALYQRICDHAREVSESTLAAVVFLLEGERTYEVRTVSLGEMSESQLERSGLALKEHSIFEIDSCPPVKRLRDSRAVVAVGLTAEMAQNKPSAGPVADPLSRARKIIAYPIMHEQSMRGALVLLRESADENAEIFGVFAVQCSLVLRFAWQIAELEKMRRLEEQLHRAQRMEAIGQLAGGIAHDFNNTLSGISGYAQLIKRRFADGNAELGEYADAMIAAAHHSAELTEKLLAFARKGALQHTDVDVHQVIRESMQILEPTIGKNVRITTYLDARASLVRGDPSALQNIIINLAINARNAMPRGGELTVRTETVTYERAQLVEGGYEIRPGTWVVVHVIDTGVGIDPTISSRVFDPFFTTDKSGTGTGLGLAMVYGTTKAHTGFVTLQSKPGKGATFSVYLPLLQVAPSPAEEVPRRKSEAIVRGQGHVLIVDDDEIIRSLSKEMLTFLGYTACTVEGGHEAIEWLREHREQADVALIDIMMPRMDGYETFHQLRKIKPDLKAVFITGYTVPKDTRYMAAVGVAGFIQKPFDSGKLSQVLFDIFHRRDTTGAPNQPGNPQQ